jgi:hypothetical protein
MGRLRLVSPDEAGDPITNIEAHEALREELEARGLDAYPQGAEPWPERRR